MLKCENLERLDDAARGEDSTITRISKVPAPKITAEMIRAMKARGEKIPALTAYDFPMARLLEEGGYHVKGKSEPEHQALLADADALVKAGAFAIVLELVTPRVAKELTQRLPVPTIGIGAGPDCDGQILVTPDLLGMLPWYSLKHVKPKLNAAEQMRSVVKEWKESVEA